MQRVGVITMIPQPFIDAIKANRNDDLPRLICADWLEEHGECERAELIRVQCEIAAIEADKNRLGGLCPASPKLMKGPCPCTWHTLKRRESQILNTQPETPTKAWNWMMWSVQPWVVYGMPYSYQGTVFTRGFVSTIECSWQDWLTHADAILKATPLERVRLTTYPTEDDFLDLLNAVHPNWVGTFTEDDQTIISLSKERWPGIEFELPRTMIRRTPIEWVDRLETDANNPLYRSQ